MRRVVVGYSMGVTSAWCLGWALRNFPKEEVIALHFDTKEEHPDTYRFGHELAAKLGIEITDFSDGRSVTELFRDEGLLGNGQNTMCSRILKRERGEKFIKTLVEAGHEVIRVVGFSSNEPKRVANAVGYASHGQYTVRFPIIEEGITKQDCADWCQCEMGVKPSAMYEHFEHANCLGCVKGGRAYWLAIAEHYPEVFEQRAQLEEEFGHTIIRGELRKGETEHPTLRQLVQIGLKRPVKQKERIEIGACDCGD